MIKNLEISRFKSIKKIKIELGQVNIFVGSNGSGKSNILEAIGISSAALYRGLGDTDLASKGIRLTPPELMKSAFKNSKIPQTFEIKTEFSNSTKYNCNLIAKPNDPLIRFHSESCLFQDAKKFGRSGNGITVLNEPIKGKLDKERGMWDQIKTAHQFPEEFSNQLNEFSKYKIYTPQTDILRGSRSGVLDHTPFGLHGEGLPSALRNVLADRFEASKEKDDKKIFNFITECLKLSFLPGWNNTVKIGNINQDLISRGLQEKNTEMVYFIDKFMKNDRNTLSVYDSSEGTLFLLFIAILLAHKESPKYFSLDNVDNSLNPLMTRKLLEKIIKLTTQSNSESLDLGPKQVFLTSHNPTSLDAFDIFSEEQRIFVVYRDAEGATTVQRLSPADGMTRDDWTIASNGKNLSQLWLDGLIEGINGFEAI